MKNWIKVANNNLTKLYGERHDKTITDQCIEKAYHRNPLGIEIDAKTKKGSSLGYMTGILYLASGKLSGINTCPFASNGCLDACLISAGRGVMYPIMRARIIKTIAFFGDKKRYTDSIKKGIRALKTKAKNKSMIPCVRLNGTSDIRFEKLTDIMQSFPEIYFYDYTKNKMAFNHNLKNYHLTFSLSESNKKDAIDLSNQGHNVAVVFRKDLPKKWNKVSVIDGDKTDLRFLDSKGKIVGLIAKGKAKKDLSGFVQN